MLNVENICISNKSHYVYIYIHKYANIYAHVIKIIKKVAMKRIRQRGNDWKEENTRIKRF